jgi:hypothetical protein
MTSLLTYIYYRALKYYGFESQAATPIQIFLAMNTATFLIVLLRFFGATSLIGRPALVVSMGILVFVVIYLLMIFLVYIYILLKKRTIDEKLKEFSKETAVERRRNGKKILWYFILSPIVFILALII